MPRKKATATKEPVAVLVTTAARGVFFGYLSGAASKERVVLTGMRNVLYWHQEVRGFLGLVSTGPTRNCRVSAAVPGESTLFGITGVYTVTTEAKVAFEKGPWA